LLYQAVIPYFLIC